MALIVRHLVRFASVPYGTSGNKAQNHYVYATEDTFAVVAAAGYFNDARGVLRTDDIIRFMSDMGSATERPNWHRVVVPDDAAADVTTVQITATLAT